MKIHIVERDSFSIVRSYYLTKCLPRCNSWFIHLAQRMIAVLLVTVLSVPWAF